MITQSDTVFTRFRCSHLLVNWFSWESLGLCQLRFNQEKKRRKGLDGHFWI